jgi:hypothetical protein
VGAGGDGGAQDAGTCAEPAECEGYEKAKPVIVCLDPVRLIAGAPGSLQIYGHHLAAAAGDVAIVSLRRADGSSVELNGTPASGCHLTAQVPAGVIAGSYMVTVSPPSLDQSNAVSLLID